MPVVGSQNVNANGRLKNIHGTPSPVRLPSSYVDAPGTVMLAESLLLQYESAICNNVFSVIKLRKLVPCRFLLFVVIQSAQSALDYFIFMGLR